MNKYDHIQLCFGRKDVFKIAFTAAIGWSFGKAVLYAVSHELRTVVLEPLIKKMKETESSEENENDIHKTWVGNTD